MVSRRFKKVFSKQEQLRTFPTYDASIEVCLLPLLCGLHKVCSHIMTRSDLLCGLHKRLVHTTTQIKTKKNVPGGTFEDKKVFFFVFSFVLTLLLLGLISISYAYVDVLCHTLDFIPLCSPLFSANPYACVVV